MSPTKEETAAESTDVVGGIPPWFVRVVGAVLGITGIPALGVMFFLWSRFAVIEAQISDLREAIRSSASMQSDIATIRAQQVALVERLTRLEARLDRSPGGP